jgi:amino acid transporter
VIGAVTIGLVIYLLLQVVFLAALPAAQVHGLLGDRRLHEVQRPVRRAGHARRPGVAGHDPLHRRRGLARRDRPHLHDGELARLVRPQPQRLRPVGLRVDHQPRDPWFGLITAFVVGCVCFLPFPSWRSLVGLITSASVLMYAGAPLALGALRRRLPDAERPYRLPSAPVIAPWRSSSPTS